MTLQPGTRIGAYEITGSLGAGGMGEVYRARDTRLERDVAIKILPALWLTDPERRARDREARVLASLNHPHIGAIYGFEEVMACGRWCSSSSRARPSPIGSRADRYRSRSPDGRSADRRRARGGARARRHPSRSQAGQRHRSRRQGDPALGPERSPRGAQAHLRMAASW
jgi:hypothetical protein